MQFLFGFTERFPIRGAKVATAIAMLKTLYDSDMIGLREITSAQVLLGRTKLPAAVFQVLFLEV